MNDEYRSVNEQKHLWPKIVNAHQGNLYSYNWGDPTSSEARNIQGELLGDYKKILECYLLPNIKDKTVLDLGCFDGKWTRWMVSASKIVCVDLAPDGFDKFSKDLEHNDVIFYQTSGCELSGIKSESVDFIFSLDSLVRSEIGIIESYIFEFKRILSADGKMCVHFPLSTQHLSWEHGFTQVDQFQIADMCLRAGLKAKIDFTTINHGILLTVGL